MPELASEVYSLDDLQKLLGGMSRSTACRVMREVKHVSDILHIRGRIHKFDWDKYLEWRAEHDR